MFGKKQSQYISEILSQHLCGQAEQNNLRSVGTGKRQNFELNTSCIFLHINQRYFYLEYMYVSSNTVRNIVHEKINLSKPTGTQFYKRQEKS
jgi:hypothetical protein